MRLYRYEALLFRGRFPLDVGRPQKLQSKIAANIKIERTKMTHEEK